MQRGAAEVFSDRRVVRVFGEGVEINADTQFFAERITAEEFESVYRTEKYMGELSMTEVRFYDDVDDGLLKFAVIIAKTDGRWVFCKHKKRDTLEVPGGHREAGEDILETAKRELYEETGALEYDIKPVCVYSVTAEDNFDGVETFGMLFFADIKRFEGELHSEIERTVISEGLAERWTYPEIQPKLIDEARRRGFV